MSRSLSCGVLDWTPCSWKLSEAVEVFLLGNKHIRKMSEIPMNLAKIPYRLSENLCYLLRDITGKCVIKPLSEKL